MNFKDFLTDTPILTDPNHIEKFETEIIDFFMSSPYPPIDKDIHKLAERFSIEPNIFEGMIYNVLWKALNGTFIGRHNGALKTYNSEQMKIGIKIEQEHIQDFMRGTAIGDRIASQIAADHLSEIEDYYTRLVRLEAEGKKNNDSVIKWGEDN